MMTNRLSNYESTSLQLSPSIIFEQSKKKKKRLFGILRESSLQTLFQAKINETIKFYPGF